MAAPAAKRKNAVYQRLRRYMKTLFLLNKEQAHQPVASMVQAEAPAEEAVEDRQLHQLYLDIVRQLEKEKWYLDAGLSLQELSTRMASNKTYVSQAVNAYSGTNVNGLLNRMRVNEAWRIILAYHIKKHDGFSCPTYQKSRTS